MGSAASRPAAGDVGVERRMDAFLALAAALVYLRCLFSDLVPSWDDGRFLVDNADVQHPSWDAFLRLAFQPHFQAWHPLHLLSYWIDVPLFGPSGPVQHGVNLALMLAALWIWRRVFRRLGLAPLAALLATLFVGLHPVQVEAVAWATGRKEVLVLLFSALMFRAHLRSEGPWDRQAWLGRFFFLLAALSKTTSLPLPVALFALDVLVRARPWRRALVTQLPALALALGLGLITVFIWREHEMIRHDATGLSLPLMTLSHDLGLLFAPSPGRLSPVYALRRDAHFELLDFLGPTAWLVAAGWAWRRGQRLALWGLVSLLILAAPTLNLVPVYFQRQVRYLSLPTIAAGVFVGAIFERASERLGRRAAIALSTAWLVFLGATNAIYQGAWRDDDALWAHATSAEPRAFYAWLKLCELERDRGHFDRAVRACERAREVQPALRVGLSALFLTQARRDEAEHHLPDRSMAYGARFHRAVDAPEALRALGAELLQAGYHEAVLVALGRSLDVEPVSDERLERAAYVQLSQGRGWLARYYIARMGREPILRELSAFLELGEHPTLPDAGAAPSSRPDAAQRP